MRIKKRARDEYKVVRRDLLVALPPFPEAMFASVKFFLGGRHLTVFSLCVRVLLGRWKPRGQGACTR